MHYIMHYVMYYIMHYVMHREAAEAGAKLIDNVQVVCEDHDLGRGIHIYICDLGGAWHMCTCTCMCMY